MLASPAHMMDGETLFARAVCYAVNGTRSAVPQG